MNKETMDYLLSDDTSKVQSNQPQTTTTPETEQQQQQETKESNEESSEQEDSDNEQQQEEDDDDEEVELIENIPEALSAAQHIVDQVSVNLEEFKKDNIDFVTSQTRAIEILNGALDIYERVLDQTVGSDEDEDEEENAGENDDDEAADEKQKEALKQRRAARESIETAKIAFDYSTALVMKLKMENSIAMFGAVMKVLAQQQQSDQTGTGSDDSAASSTAATSSATATAAASSSSSSSSSSRKIFAFNDDSDEDEEQEEAEENDDEAANNHEEEEDTSAMALSMVEMAKSILNNKMYDDETSESEKQLCYTLLSKIHCNAADIFLEHDAFDMAINEAEQALGLYDDIDMDQSVEDIEAVSRLVEHMKQKAVIHNKIASSVLFKDGADIDMAIEHYEEAESLLVKCVEKMKQVNGMNQEAIQDTEFTLEELQVRIQELKQSEEERKALEEQSKLAETKGQENSNKPVHVLVPKRKRTASEEDVATTEANKKQKLA